MPPSPPPPKTVAQDIEFDCLSCCLYIVHWPSVNRRRWKCEVCVTVSCPGTAARRELSACTVYGWGRNQDFELLQVRFTTLCACSCARACWSTEVALPAGSIYTTSTLRLRACECSHAARPPFLATVKPQIAGSQAGREFSGPSRASHRPSP